MFSFIKIKKIIPVIFTCSDYTERIRKQRRCWVRVWFAYGFGVGGMRVKVTDGAMRGRRDVSHGNVTHLQSRSLYHKEFSCPQQLERFGSCSNHCNRTRIRTGL